MVLTPHPHLQCRGLKLGRAIPIPALIALVARKGGTFTFRFLLRKEEYGHYVEFGIAVLIPQSLQLQAQMTLMSLG